MPKKAQSSLLSIFEEKENCNPNAAPVSRQQQAVVAPALQPVNNDIVDLIGACDEVTNNPKVRWFCSMSLLNSGQPLLTF